MNDPIQSAQAASGNAGSVERPDSVVRSENADSLQAAAQAFQAATDLLRLSVELPPELLDLASGYETSSEARSEDSCE